MIFGIFGILGILDVFSVLASLIDLVTRASFCGTCLSETAGSIKDSSICFEEGELFIETGMDKLLQG